MRKKLLVVLLALVMVFSISAAALADAPVLTITGSGVKAEITYTADDLAKLEQVTRTYSTCNNYHFYKFFKFTGYDFFSLLGADNLVAGVDEITFVSADGYKSTASLRTLQDGKVYFEFTADGKNETVAPMLATAELQLSYMYDGAEVKEHQAEDDVITGKVELKDADMTGAEECFKVVFGQSSPAENNNSRFVKDVATIIVGDELPAAGGTDAVKPAATPAFSKCAASSQKLSVNGKEQACSVYNIDGSNYFMLRDIAYLLKDTADKFSVSYDETARVVTAVSGEAYVAAGTELKTGADQSASCVPSTQGALFNGKPSTAYAYNIGGSNYFQLRGLGEAFGFSVAYDEATRTMLVTSSDYQQGAAQATKAEETDKAAVLTVNGTAFTLEQVQAAKASELTYRGKNGDVKIKGAALSALVKDMPAATASVVVMELDRYNPEGLKLTGAELATAVIGYQRDGAAFTDSSKGDAKISSVVALYYTSAAGEVEQIKLPDTITW